MFFQKILDNLKDVKKISALRGYFFLIFLCMHFFPISQCRKNGKNFVVDFTAGKNGKNPFADFTAGKNGKNNTEKKIQKKKHLRILRFTTSEQFQSPVGTTEKNHIFGP